MITARPQKNAATAKLYFREHLVQNGAGTGQSAARWLGEGVARLDLDPDQPVTAEAFDRLCDNLHPLTAEPLTARTREGRRIYFDFVVSPPKSASIAEQIGGDRRIRGLHERAVATMFRRLEPLAATRVHEEDRDGDRTTGELVAVAINHSVSRAGDPQTHTHLVVFNATWDPVEQRWKALQTSGIFEQLSFLTEVYRSELAAGLKELGYSLRKSGRGFEIEGVPAEVIKTFSKRRAQMDAEETRWEAILGRAITPADRAVIAQATRAAKEDRVADAEALSRQRAQLSPGQLAKLEQLKNTAPGQRRESNRVTPAEALDHARDHLFERGSAVARHELLKGALVFGRGDVRVDELESNLAARTEFIRAGERLTTRETLRLERELVEWVNTQAGRHRPFSSRVPDRYPLNEAQKQALTHLLRSPDGVSQISGGAGTGKTWVLSSFVQALVERKQNVFVCAPTTGAVDVLLREGFSGAQTVQRLLTDEKLQADIASDVILVDEANLLSVRQFHALFLAAKARGCRVVLSGDTRQHHSVEAGDALRVLEQFSELRSARLDHIQRQKPKNYRHAVAEIAVGRMAQGFAELNQMGAIVEMNTGRVEKLAVEFAASIRGNKSALVVAPTWREIGEVTDTIRQRLKREKLVSWFEREVQVHDGLDWTEAQRRDVRNYWPGLVLRFHKSTEQFRAGEWAQVATIEADRIVAKKWDGTTGAITRKQAKCFDVARVKQLAVSPGDRLLIQANCRASRLINGQIVTVRSVSNKGRIRLTDGRMIGAGFRSFTHGYCITSHAAEGKTVDHVYLSASSDSFVAANREQFYVSVSRGRYKARIFTDDRAGLFSAVQTSAERLSAIELTAGLRRRHVSKLVQIPKAHVATNIAGV